MTRRDVVVLGSTGSIGTQALDVVRANPDRFRVVGAHRRGGPPRPVRAAGGRVGSARRFSGLGEDASVEAAALPCDVVLNGITGAVGLRPTLAALDAGSTLALANKESLIIGGPVVTGRAKPGQIVPVDSEHSALAQCLRGGSRRRGTPARADRQRRPVPGADARTTWPTSRSSRRWPTRPGRWARWSRSTPRRWSTRGSRSSRRTCCSASRSTGSTSWSTRQVVHSMVEFVDGSTLAQASPPTMMIPIALGLGWPDRVPDAARRWTGPAPRPGSSSRSTTRRSRPSRWPARRERAGGTAPGRLQRRQRGVRRGVPGPAAAVH